MLTNELELEGSEMPWMGQCPVTERRGIDMSIPVPKKYVADFEQLGFGMFVHWGLYSQLGKGEWIWDIGKIDRKSVV